MTLSTSLGPPRLCCGSRVDQIPAHRERKEVSWPICTATNVRHCIDLDIQRLNLWCLTTGLESCRDEDVVLAA
jgi:hypothetical protein